MTAAEIPLDPPSREQRALAMAIAGAPVEKIAEKFAWTVEEAHAAVERALLRTTVDRNPEGVAYARNMTQQRLEHLLSNLWGAANDPSDPVIQNMSAKTVLGIVDRQVALYGANAPKETTVTHQISPEQVAATIERLFEARSGVIEAQVVPALGSTPAVPGEVVVDSA